MRTMLTTRISIGLHLVAATLAISSCSSDDTVLAVTIDTDEDLRGTVERLQVTVSRPSGDSAMESFVPDMSDAGALPASFFRRITLKGWKGGDATVTVEAFNAADTLFLTASTTTDLRE